MKTYQKINGQLVEVSAPQAYGIGLGNNVQLAPVANVTNPRYALPQQVDYSLLSQVDADTYRRNQMNARLAQGASLAVYNGTGDARVQAELDQLRRDLARLQCVSGLQGRSLPSATTGNSTLNYGPGQVGGDFAQISYIESETVIIPGNATAGDTFELPFSADNLGQMYGNSMCAVSFSPMGGILAASPERARWTLYDSGRESNIELPLQFSVKTADGLAQWSQIQHFVKQSKDPSFRITITNDLGGTTPTDDTALKVLVMLGTCANNKCDI